MVWGLHRAGYKPVPTTTGDHERFTTDRLDIGGRVTSEVQLAVSQASSTRPYILPFICVYLRPSADILLSFHNA